MSNFVAVHVDASIPVQTKRYIFGQEVAHLSENELFGACAAITAEIEGLEKSNEGIESEKIAARVESLKADLVTVRNILDEVAAPVVTAQEITAA